MTRRWLTLAGRALLGAAGLIALAYVVWHDLAAWSAASRQSPAATPEPNKHASASAPAHPVLRPSACGHLKIGWTAWADAEFVTQLAARLLREELGCDVQLVMTDIGVQYRGLASGELDLMLMAWLPVTHAPYFDKVAQSVVNLGPLYTGARLGWAVPAYVPEGALSSIEDMHKTVVTARLGGRIQGIDPGSGLMQASERALVDYELSAYRLRGGSGAAMTAALERAIRLKRWIVVTAWSPHWMFARWDLRYLDDPKHILSQHERVYALARHDFGRDFPSAVVDLITRMYIPMDELEQALLHAVDSSTQAAVDQYVREHPARIRYWVSGALQDHPE